MIGNSWFAWSISCIPLRLEKKRPRPPGRSVWLMRPTRGGQLRVTEGIGARQLLDVLQQPVAHCLDVRARLQPGTNGTAPTIARRRRHFRHRPINSSRRPGSTV